MGQSPSSQPSNSHPAADPPKLDFRVTDPVAHAPTGLALIAHGRRATIDCPVVAALATCLREKHGCRTVTWSARGVGNSEGTTGSHANNREDYNRMLEMAMDSFTREFPDVTDCRLLICGHDCGAAYAGSIRPPSSPRFDRKTRYVLISYSALSVDLSLRATGYHHSALESLVQGGDPTAEGRSPEVLIFTGRENTESVRTLCSLWIGTQMGKIQGDSLEMRIVEGADWDWVGYYDKIADVTDEWLLQQPRGELEPPSQGGSASAASSDQTQSIPASLPIVRGRPNRFSDQVL